MHDPRSKTEQTEAEWEREVLENALGDALNSDGTVDFDKLDAMTERFEIPTPEIEPDEPST